MPRSPDHPIPISVISENQRLDFSLPPFLRASLHGASIGLLQFSVLLTGVGWILLRVLSQVLLFRVPAFIKSTITHTAFRIW